MTQSLAQNHCEHVTRLTSVGSPDYCQAGVRRTLSWPREALVYVFLFKFSILYKQDKPRMFKTNLAAEDICDWGGGGGL